MNLNWLTFKRFCLATSLALAIAFQFTRPELARCETPSSAPGGSTPGKHEYQQACARCHGKTGKGGGTTAAASTEKPADLTKLTKSNGGVFPEAKILRIIHDTEPIAAHGPREAPVWGKRFSLRMNVSSGAAGVPVSSAQVDYRVKQLVQYLKSIQEK